MLSRAEGELYTSKSNSRSIERNLPEIFGATGWALTYQFPDIYTTELDGGRHLCILKKRRNSGSKGKRG